jgi:hypothetical protein
MAPVAPRSGGGAGSRRAGLGADSVIYVRADNGGREERMYKPSQEALDKHAADVSAAAERGKLLDAARAADVALREAEARNAPVTQLHRLAKDLDAALTDAMRAAYAAERAAIGPRGYDDRIFARKAKAKPDVHELTAAAERLLTLRENHRLNRIPEVPRVPAV